MPKFVAHDPSRLPPHNTADLDMGLVSLRVAALEEKLSLLSVSSQHGNFHVRRTCTSTVVDSAATSNEVSTEEAEEGHTSWAGIARNLHVGDFHQVVRASTSATTILKENSSLISRRNLHHVLYHQVQRTSDACCVANVTSKIRLKVYLGAYMHLSAG